MGDIHPDIPSVSTCPTYKVVYLVVCAYIKANVKKRSIVLKVYIHDELQKDKVESGQSCIINTPLRNLPDVITADTTFQCVIIFEKAKWKKLILNKVRIYCIRYTYNNCVLIIIKSTYNHIFCMLTFMILHL